MYFEKPGWGRFAIWLTKMDWKYQVLMYLKGCSIQLELDVMLVHHTGANELTKSTDFTVTGENWNLSDFLPIIVGLKIGLLLLDDFQATFLLWIKLAQNLSQNHEESIWFFQECWHLSFFGAIGWGTERFMAVLATRSVNHQSYKFGVWKQRQIHGLFTCLVDDLTLQVCADFSNI